MKNGLAGNLPYLVSVVIPGSTLFRYSIMRRRDRVAAILHTVPIFPVDTYSPRMNREFMTRFPGVDHSHRSRTGALLLLLMIGLSCAGCIGPFEPETPPGTPAEPGLPEPLPSVNASPQPTTPGTPARGVPAETPFSAYIGRSYGYAPYVTPPDYRLTLIESSARRDASGNVIISGRVKNEGPDSLTYLHMTFNLFDASGNQLGNAHASIEYLGSGKTWRFETAPAPGTGYQFFELARVVAQ
jgi:hypothetical protein